MIYRYAHPELFEKWDKPDLSKYSGRLVLWGAGRIGEIASHCLKSKQIVILAYVDSNKELWGTQFCGCKVISPDALKRDYSDAAVLITSSFHDDIESLLVGMGTKTVFNCVSLFMEFEIDNNEFRMGPEYAIRNVEQYLNTIYINSKKISEGANIVFAFITLKCNLRCRECSAFVPYIKKPCDYSVATIVHNLTKLLDLIEYALTVNIVGGEPLLHSDLSQLIKRFKNESRIKKISITSNGTKVPDNELLLAMKGEPRFFFRISDYGNLSSKKENVRQLLKSKGIACEITNYSFWNEGTKVDFNNSSEEQLRHKFTMCTLCHNLYIIENKVFLCQPIAILSEINALPLTDADFFDLSKEYSSLKEKKNEFLKFVNRRFTGEYLVACKYCSGQVSNHFNNRVPVAEQTTESLTFPKVF